MKITFLCVGRIKKTFVKEGFAEYAERIRRYSSLEVFDIKEEAATSRTPKEEILKREGERVLDRLKPHDYVIVLSDNGKSFTSKGFSGFMEGLLNAGERSAVFIVGGPWGLHESVYEAADTVLSLSRMTLPHDLARLLLSEQVYRAFTIMRGEPYSH